jgi:prepilin signal peptidase PulO-like enzyme (type II secretory pathway)
MLLATMLAESMIEWGNTKIGELIPLVENGTGLAAIAVIALTYLATKNFVKTAVAGVLAGLVLFAVSNVDWFKTHVGEEFSLGTPHAVVVEYQPPTAL